MCGIAGLYYAGSPEEGSRILHTLTGAMAHRGPDGEGHFEQAPFFLGHRRLSIIDLSATGAQPMSDVSGRYTIVFNGEIYNYKQLRAELAHYPFRSQSDSEVILAAWAQWGEECLHRLAGMWAFAIHDREAGTLTLSRDRFGVKPLYYASRRGHFAFASELRPLLASGLVEKQLNADALQEYLLYQSVSAPATLVQGLFLLGPGENLVHRQGVSVIKRWWSLEEQVKPLTGELNAQTATKQVRQLLEQAVARRMVADVPVAAFLSGGIDSSAVVALMARQSAGPIDTFSVVFDEKDFDESQWSQLIARKYNTRHHPIRLRPADFLKEVPAALHAMDHPSGDGPNSFVVSKVTQAQGIKVALSGIGGDELFAGYPFFKRVYKLSRNPLLRFSPAFVKRATAGLVQAVPGGRRGAQMASLLRLPRVDLAHLLPAYRVLFQPALAATLLKGESKPMPVQQWLQSRRQPLERLPLLSQLSIAELQFYLHNVLLRDTDQMSMASSLEVREPFLDHELVTAVLALPDAIKFPSTPKKLLTDALGDLLPRELTQRRKMGFTFPWAHWLRNELAGWCEHRMERLEMKGVFRHGAVKALWTQFKSGDKNILWNHVWLLAVLDEWMEANGVEG